MHPRKRRPQILVQRSKRVCIELRRVFGRDRCDPKRPGKPLGRAFGHVDVGSRCDRRLDRHVRCCEDGGESNEQHECSSEQQEECLHGRDSSEIAYGSTRKPNIIPLSWCSAMWQCAIHTPGCVASKRMSTVWPVGTSTVSFQTRLGS